MMPHAPQGRLSDLTETPPGSAEPVAQQPAAPAAPQAGDKKPAGAAEPAAKKNIGKEKAKQRNRAITLIQRHAGTYAQEGQKTKWIIDLCMKIDEEYKQGTQQQQEATAALQGQLKGLQESSSQEMARMTQQIQALQDRLQERDLQLHNKTYALQTAQAEHAEMQESLHFAEQAAAAANSECAALAAAVQAMTERDAKARCSLAHRAHQLRGALLQTSAALRQYHQRGRQETDARHILLKEKEAALAAERAALLAEQGAQQARDAALEMLQLKHHLAVLKIKELNKAGRPMVPARLLQQQLARARQAAWLHQPETRRPEQLAATAADRGHSQPPLPQPKQQSAGDRLQFEIGARAARVCK